MPDPWRGASIHHSRETGLWWSGSGLFSQRTRLSRACPDRFVVAGCEICGVYTIIFFMSKSRSSSQVARHLIPFDADDCFECRSELVSEKPRTAIGVHQNRAFPACADVVHDFSSDLIIGLRESSDGVILSNRNVAARRQSLATQLSQLAVNYIGSKGAACNINDLATFLPKKSTHRPIRLDP